MKLNSCEKNVAHFNIIPAVYLHNSLFPIDKMQMLFVVVLLICLQKAAEI